MKSHPSDVSHQIAPSLHYIHSLKNVLRCSPLHLFSNTSSTFIWSDEHDEVTKWIRTVQTKDAHIWTLGPFNHYDDVVMGAIASHITSLTIVYTTVYWDSDQSKHQSSASLAFVWGIHRAPVNSPHKWPVTRKMFPFHDVIMSTKICWTSVACTLWITNYNYINPWDVIICPSSAVNDGFNQPPLNLQGYESHAKWC